MAEYEEATSGDVIKFEKEGDFVEGKFITYEESKMYPGSFAVKVESALTGVHKVVFVSNIVIDLLKANSIMTGMDIKIIYEGKKKTKDGSKEYNDYKLFFKKE